MPTPSKNRQDNSLKRFVGQTVAPDEQGFLEVCPDTDLLAEDAVRFDFREKTYALYRAADNKLYATDGVCTHGKTHLTGGVVIGNQIECPKHNGRFNLVDGSVARPPVQVPINTYVIKEENGKIFVNVDVPLDDIDQTKAYSFEVISNESVSTYIRELLLKPLDGPFSYLPGQYVQMEIPAYEMKFRDLYITPPFDKIWKSENLFGFFAMNKLPSKRNFSMASNPENENTIRFNVRMEFPPPGLNCNAGIGSSYVYSLKTGDKVTLFGPMGDFLIKDTEKEMVYLGGGAGMAPLRAHLAYLFETLGTKRKVSYWYGARSYRELFYFDYLREMEQKHENFTFIPALSEPLKTDNWNSYTGFVHEVLFKEYLNKHENISNIEFYLCGPPVMIQAANKMLTDLEVAKENIAFDEF